MRSVSVFSFTYMRKYMFILGVFVKRPAQTQHIKRLSCRMVKVLHGSERRGTQVYPFMRSPVLSGPFQAKTRRFME